MSNVCDCDKKTSNGGTCDSSCNEETFSIVENNSLSTVSFTPVFAVARAAAVETISFESSGSTAGRQ